MLSKTVACLAAFIACTALAPARVAAQQRAWWGTNTWTGGVTWFPQSGPHERPYSVYYRPPDHATHPMLDYDEFSLSFPADFDPSLSYPVWIKFLPFYGSFTGIYHHTFADNYCDANQVICIGFAARSGSGAGSAGGEWLGDNGSGWDDVYYYGSTIRDDLKELISELCHLFNVEYFAFTGASMGGYSSFRIAVDIPRDYFGAVVASCPAIFQRDWVAGQDLIEQKVRDGWFDDRLVFLMHGTDDDTVPVVESDRLDGGVPDRSWWNYHRIQGAGHEEFFMIWDGNDEDWGQVAPSVSADPDYIWGAVAQWEGAHPSIAGTVLPPLPGWTPPASTDDWYIPQDLVQWALSQQGGPTATPAPTGTPTAVPTATPTGGMFPTSTPSATPTEPTPVPTSTPTPGGGATGQRRIVSLAEILAASEYLGDGEIPEDGTTTVGKTPLYVATDGDDANDGLTLNTPKRHLGAAITHANGDPGTAFVIYLRGGTYYRQSDYEYLQIERGDLVITAYPGEQVTIRPDFWPNSPTSWGEQVFLYSYGGIENLTISDLTLQGWDTPFIFGADWGEQAMENIVLKDITANEFRRRFAELPATFFSTGYVDRSFFPGGATTFDPNAPGIKYQIEGLILSNIALEDVGMGVNIGDEEDANVKGLRISRVEVRNDPQGGGDSATDAFAIVNSHKALIDHCIVDNISDDGIDCKAFDVCVVNSYVHGTGRNGVKFWRNGEVINSIVYDCAPINDGAFIIEAGPFRIINSVLMRKTPGYAGSFNYGATSSEAFEIVNSVLADLDHTFYVGTSGLRSTNSLYHDMPGGLFSGQTSAADVAALNALPNCSGNIEGDPLFTNPQGEDFTLRESSPCRDAGVGAGTLLPSFDYYGNARPAGQGYDIGPCEYIGYSAGGDEDSDGLLNLEEDRDMNGSVDPGETDPNDPDTDDDGLGDLLEVVCGSAAIALDPGLRPPVLGINFQPVSSGRPSGYVPDGAGGYGAATGFGWR